MRPRAGGRTEGGQKEGGPRERGGREGGRERKDNVWMPKTIQGQNWRPEGRKNIVIVLWELPCTARYVATGHHGLFHTMNTGYSADLRVCFRL